MVDGAEHAPSETAVVVAPVLHDQRLHPAAAGQVLLACIRAIAQFRVSNGSGFLWRASGIGGFVAVGSLLRGNCIRAIAQF